MKKKIGLKKKRALFLNQGTRAGAWAPLGVYLCNCLMRSHHFRRLIFSGCFCLCWPFRVAPRMFREALHMIFSKSFIDPRESFACAIRHQPSPSTVPETATRPPELQTPLYYHPYFRSAGSVCVRKRRKQIIQNQHVFSWGSVDSFRTALHYTW